MKVLGRSLSNVRKETVEGGDDWGEDNEILDPDAFAAEIAEQLENVDQGDGTTNIHLAIDRAAYQAIENGSEAVRLASDRDDDEE